MSCAPSGYEQEPPLNHLLAGVMLLLAGMPAAIPGPERAGPEADLRQIESAIESFVIAYNAGDVDRLLSAYDTAFVDMPLGTETISGSAAIVSTRERLEQTFANYTGRLEVDTQEIRVEGNLAFDRGVLTVTLTPRSGGERITVRRRFLEIWKKSSAGHWRVFRAMDND